MDSLARVTRYFPASTLTVYMIFGNLVINNEVGAEDACSWCRGPGADPPDDCSLPLDSGPRRVTIAHALNHATRRTNVAPRTVHDMA